MGKHSADEERQPGRLRIIVDYCKPLYARYRKFIVAAAGAALTAFFAVVTDGVTPEEWVYIIMSAGAAIGVCAFPNAPNSKKVKVEKDVKVQQVRRKNVS